MEYKFTKKICKYEYEIEFTYRKIRYCTNITAQTECDAIRKLKSNFGINIIEVHSCTCMFKIV